MTDTAGEPRGRVWTANYRLNIEATDRSWALERPEVFACRLRPTTDGFVVLLAVGDEQSTFVVDHPGAVAIARFLHDALPDAGRELVHGDAPPWPSALVPALPPLAPVPEPMWATTWEYRSLKRSTLNLDGLIDELNALGGSGWELVNFDTADRTLGTNAYVALLRRPTGRIDLQGARRP